MKKYFLLFLLCFFILITTTGCNNDQLEGSNITTTIYPIEYLVNTLYGNKSTITSIYPNGTNINEYELTSKQIDNYSKSTTLFVYNGQSDEKEIAKTLINKNKKIQIIDASYGLQYKYGVEELWLNPNNFLMLATTIKDDLKNLSSSKYTGEEIEKNYNNLEESLTTLDAEIRTIAKEAIKDKNNTIIIAYNSFGFLETYGFNIINISSENNITSTIKNRFKDKTYTKILVEDKDNVSDSIKDIVDNYGAELIEINTMATLTDKERSNGDNYLSIMNDFITNLTNVINQ